MSIKDGTYDAFTVKADKDTVQIFNKLCLDKSLAMPQQILLLAEKMIEKGEIPFSYTEQMLDAAREKNGKLNLVLHMPLSIQNDFIDAAKKSGVTRYVVIRLYIIACAKEGRLVKL